MHDLEAFAGCLILKILVTACFSTSEDESTMKKQLDNMLTSVSEQEQVSHCAYIILKTVSAILSALLQLQAAAQASYFLASYDSRQLASAISVLREQIEAARKTQLGKKKFGFSRKPKRLPASQPAEAAAPLTDLQANLIDSKSKDQQMSTHPGVQKGAECTSANQHR